jgi:hypothetical protein
MKRLLALSLLLLPLSGCYIVGAEVLPGFTKCARPIKATDLQAEDTSAPVAQTVAAMGALGFAEIHALPCVDERIVADVRTVNLEGKRYTWQALIFRGAFLEDRIAARRLTLATGARASRTVEFQLFLRGAIPLAYHGGGWLPPRQEGGPPKTGDRAWVEYAGAVEEVETLADGRRVLHVRPAGEGSPYFAVETRHELRTVRTEQRVEQERAPGEVQAEGEAEEVLEDGSRGTAFPLGRSERGAQKARRYALPAEAALRASGAVKEGENLLAVVGVEEEPKKDAITVGAVHYRTRLVTVEIPLVRSWTTAEIYPYDETGKYGD